MTVKFALSDERPVPTGRLGIPAYALQKESEVGSGWTSGTGLCARQRLPNIQASVAVLIVSAFRQTSINDEYHIPLPAS